MSTIILIWLFVNSVFCLSCVKKLDIDTLSEDAATVVNISATISEVYFTSIINMEVEVTLLLHQRWFDSSLSNDKKTQEKAVGGQIWRPKITMTKGCLFGCVNNEDTQFWRGFGKESNVLLSEKFVIRTKCTRNFQKYPFDAQICELKFGTYLFPVEELNLRWENQSVDIQSSTSLNGFELINVTTFNEKDLRVSGTFDVLVLQLVVKRHFCNYMISVITVWIVLVLVSYGSFWVDHERIIFRLSICLSSLLFLMYIYVTFSFLVTILTVLSVLDWFFILNLIFIAFALFQNGLISRVLFYRHANNDKLNHFDNVITYIDYGCRLFYPVFYLLCLILFLFKLLY